MSGEGDGGEEFTTAGALTLSIDERSLSDARDTVEDELGDIEVSVSADSGGLGGGGAGGALSNSMDDLVTQGDTNISLDETRNELLRDIEDLLEQIAQNTRGGDGGLFRPRLPRGGGGSGGTGVGVIFGTGAGAGAATAFGITAPDETPDTPETPTGAADGLPIALPDPFDDRLPGQTPTVSEGALSRQIAANRVGPNVGAQATAAGFLATGGLGVGLAGARLGATGLGSLGSGLFGGEAGGAAGALGLGGLGLPPTIADLPTGDLGALIMDTFTEERSAEAAVAAALQNAPGLLETSLSTAAGQRSLTGTSTVNLDGGGGGAATSPSATLADATLVDVFSRGDEFVATVRLNGQTFTRPVSELPQPLRERALSGRQREDAGDRSDRARTQSPARSGATRRERDGDEDTTSRVREEVARAISGQPTTGPRDRPGSSNTRL